MNKNTKFLFLSSSSSSNNANSSTAPSFFFALTQRLLQFTSKVHPNTAADSIVPALVAGRAHMLTKYYQQKESSSSTTSTTIITTDQLAVINETITQLSVAALRRTMTEGVGLLVYDTTRFLPLLQLLPLLKRQTQRVENFRLRQEKRNSRKMINNN